MQFHARYVGRMLFLRQFKPLSMSQHFSIDAQIGLREQSNILESKFKAEIRFALVI